MYLMQTVSTGPSSRSFPHVDKLDEITIMNSAEDISKYSDNNSHYRSPTLARRAGTELHEPQEKPKKDKKWSLGGFFRRKKKEIESESSSEEETPPKRGFLQRRKQKKEEKRKKRGVKPLGHFDHIVVTPIHHGSNIIINGNKELDESGGVFSEPAIGATNYSSARSSNERIASRESLSKKQDLSLSRGSLASQDSLNRKSRREKAKARAEALRDRLKNDSSSDDGSQRSTASSITKFKSDDSLSKKDSTTRKSRAARTERYNKRLTKEDEHVLDKEAEMEKQRSAKPDVDSQQTKVQVNRWVVVDEVPNSPPIKPYIKPTLNYSPSVSLPQKSYPGVSTIPPSHNLIHRTTSNLSDGPRNYFNASHKPTNIYNNPVRHPVDPMRSIPRHFATSYEKPDFKPEQRSFSYDCNINRSPTLGSEEQILHVHFPIGKPIPKQRNPSLINNNQNMVRPTPPPPPPRDPQRRFFTNSQYENTRPMSYAFENGSHSRPVPVHQPSFDRSSSVRSYNMPPININRANSFGWPNYRSCSEDHIAQANIYNPPVVTRPASATPDVPQQRFIRRHPSTEQYKYFAEKTPRSRKPIHIAAAPPDQPYLSDSQVMTRNFTSRHPVHAASEFWKQKDAEEINRRKSQIIEQKDKVQKSNKKSEDPKKNFAVLSIPVKTADSLSSLSGNSDTSPLNTKPFFDDSVRPLSIVSERSEVQDTSDSNKHKKDPPEPPVRRYSRQSSASSSENNWNNDLEETEKKKRPTSNLEDALDELEAIYKSLRLGDEDLLDRAERRDFPSAVTEKLLTNGNYVNWNTPGTQSDSGFNYDFDCVDGLPRKRNYRKSTIPDKLNDDMAYRRLNKERPPPLDHSVSVSQVSYLLASPVLGAPPVDENDNESSKMTNEPDITLDDVVYRNIKHTNNSLKVTEPQPPFGIPIGPISGAANSDYLHAVPDNNIRPRFIPRKSPDIVKDDLAYRSLRKDSSGFVSDDYVNNNSKPECIKKRKAVRSITTNIYNMMHRDSLRSTESESEFDKSQSLTDIADAMEIARQILKKRQDKIYRKSASSDTELKPFKNLNCSSNTQTSTETLIEAKSNQLIDQKAQLISGSEETINQKPPICPTLKSSKPPTKESTPITASPAPEEDNSLDKNHLTDLLTALAIEARETSEKLGNDLKLLDEEQSRKASPRISQPSTPAREEAKSPIQIKTLDETLSDIDAVSEHAKLCEKLLGAVVESTKLISHTIHPNNESELEEVIELPNEPTIYKSVANVIVTRNAVLPQTDARLEQCSESEHDYENIHKDDNEEETCTSPFEENKVKLLADFEELKKDLFSEEEILISKDLCAPVDDATFEKLQGSCSVEGEECSAVCLASKSTEFDHSNDIFIPPESFTTGFNSPFDDIHNYIPLLSRNRIKEDSEHSSGFHTESSEDSSLNAFTDFAGNQSLSNDSQSFGRNQEVDDILHQIVDGAFTEKFDDNFLDRESRLSTENCRYNFDNKASPTSDLLSNIHEIYSDSPLTQNQDNLNNFINESTILIASNIEENESDVNNCVSQAKDSIIVDNCLVDDPNIVLGSNSIVMSSFGSESNISDYKSTKTEIIDQKNLSSDSEQATNSKISNIVSVSLSSSSSKSDSIDDNPSQITEQQSKTNSNYSSTFSISKSSSSDSSSSSALHDYPSTSSSSCFSQDKLDPNPVVWYRDPTNIALACSYTLAFLHQIAILDFVTLLGILLAIVTVVAAFVL